MFTLEPNNINHSTLISPPTQSVFNSALSCPLEKKKKYLTLYAISQWLAVRCVSDMIKLQVLRPKSTSAPTPHLPLHRVSYCIIISICYFITSKLQWNHSLLSFCKIYLYSLYLFIETNETNNENMVQRLLCD